MQFRKSTSLFLAMFILFSNLGLAFNVHYCHDKVASISLDYQFKEVCVEEVTSCCAVAKSHSECCSNKIVKVEKKTDKNVVTAFQVHLDVPALSKKQNIDCLSTESTIGNQPVPFYCDSNAPPFYKLYCQLVFYA